MHDHVGDGTWTITLLVVQVVVMVVVVEEEEECWISRFSAVLYSIQSELCCC